MRSKLKAPRDHLDLPPRNRHARDRRHRPPSPTVSDPGQRRPTAITNAERGSVSGEAPARDARRRADGSAEQPRRGMAIARSIVSDTESAVAQRAMAAPGRNWQRRSAASAASRRPARDPSSSSRRQAYARRGCRCSAHQRNIRSPRPMRMGGWRSGTGTASIGRSAVVLKESRQLCCTAGRARA